MDSHYELPLAFDITQASTNDSPKLLPLIEDVEFNHREIYADIDETSADKESLRDASLLRVLGHKKTTPHCTTNIKSNQ